MSWPAPTIVIPHRGPDPVALRARRTRRITISTLAVIGLAILTWATFPWWWETDGPFDLTPWAALLLYIVAVVLIASVGPVLTRPRCPACHHRAAKVVDRGSTRLAPGSLTLIYRCTRCQAPLRYDRTSTGEERWQVLPLSRPEPAPDASSADASPV